MVKKSSSMKKPMKRRSCMYGGADTISVANLRTGYDAFMTHLLVDNNYLEDVTDYDTLVNGVTITGSDVTSTELQKKEFQFTADAIKKAAEAATGGVAATDIDVTVLNSNYDAFLRALVKNKGYIDTTGTATWNNTLSLYNATITPASALTVLPSAPGTTVSFAAIAKVPFKFTKDAIEAAFAAAETAAAAGRGAAGALLAPGPGTAAAVPTVKKDKITIEDYLTEVTIPIRVGITNNVKVDTKNIMIEDGLPGFRKLSPVSNIVKQEPIKDKVENMGILETLTTNITTTLGTPALNTNKGEKVANRIASLMYASEKLKLINDTLKGEKVGNETDNKKMLYYVKAASTSASTSAITFDGKVVNHIKAAFLKHQADILAELTELLLAFTTQAGGKSKDSKQRRFKGGFQELDVAKMYNAQGLVTDLDATLSQHLITNANSIPGPFSAGGLTQSSEGIDANLGASIKADVVPSYNGGSKKNKSSRQK